MDRHRRDQREQEAADRLLRSADVLLAAREDRLEAGGGEGLVDMWVGDDRPPSERPDRPFCYEELVEGMCFLIRCGLVEPVQPRGGNARR
ncbi:MAG: hypothetical protein QM783_16125 [Phycisphaerales bacterium]